MFGVSAVVPRAAVAGWVALTLAAVAHVVEHGRLPHPGVMLLLWAAAAVVVAPLLRRADASRASLTAALVAGQLLLHTAFTALSGHGSTTEPVMAGMPEAGQPTEALPGMLHHLVEDLDPRTQAAMLAAHVLAGVLAACWLFAAERRLLHLAAVASARLLAPGQLWRCGGRIAVTVSAAPAAFSRRAGGSGWALPLCPDAGPIGRRGPPVLLAA